MNSQRMIALGAAAIVCAKAAMGTAANAQETGQEEAAAEPPYVIGSFVVNPSLEVTEGYTDNLFVTRNDKQADSFTTFTPMLTVSSDWDRHSLSMEADAEIVRYGSFSDEDYTNYGVGGEGRFDFSTTSYAFGGVRYDHETEPRDSPDVITGTRPTTYNNPQGFAGFYHRIDDIKIRVGGTIESLDFNDVPTAAGTINNDDRDRVMSTLGTRVGYQLDPRFEAFIQASLDKRDYDTATDDFGFQRSSSGERLGVGVSFDLGPQLRGEGMIGYLGQRYDDPRFSTVNEPDFAASVTWRPTAETTVAGWLSRDIGETTLNGSPGYISTVGGARVDQRLLSDLTVNAWTAYSESRYEDISRTDIYLLGGGGMRYYLTPNFYLTGDYTFIQRDSTTPAEDYTENVVLFGIGTQLIPAYDEEAWSQSGGLARLFEGNSELAGAYLGTQLEFGDVDTELAGTRGAGGTLTADFGNAGFGYGVFGGYGVTHNDWYLGLELDANDSETYWNHARSDEGRFFEVHKDESYAASFRVGYLANARSMVYGRLGLALTTFNTQYLHNGVLEDQDNSLFGIRIGSGVEAPLYGGLFTRLDYSFTAYPDYNVFTNRRTDFDNFANSEAQMRLGVGYRFGGSNEEVELEPFDFGGFYLAGAAGYGGVNSDVHGPRTPPSDIGADFGDTGGTLSAFAGYGYQFSSPIYAGVELEVGFSDTSWDKERDPTGSTFSVEKNQSYGAALRLGYVVSDIALLYGRVGPVWGAFDTDYITGGGTTINQQDTLDGIRYGGGIDIAATENVFIRADYTYTSYDDYDVFRGANTSDNFKITESLFRLGLGYRF